MNRSKRAEVFRKAECDFNRAKDSLDDACRILEENGLGADAEKLFKIIYRIEAFQNKYEAYRM